MSRGSARNASKSKQATSRKKILEKMTLEDIKPSSRKYPHINFNTDREAGNDLLEIHHLNKTVNDSVMFQDFNLTVHRGEKIAFYGA